MLGQTAFAPGARVLIRDEEWMIRRAQPARVGSAVTVVGLSELVRNQEALFLTELDEVTLLQAEDTRLVRDESPGHRQARLYLEALLRRTPPTDARLVVGHRAAIQRTPYQWEPAAQALRQLRPRILMADGVGLGKTIEVGILLAELIRRGKGQRILVVALKSLLAQIQSELWARFTIPLVRLDSVGIQRVQAKIPSNQNPFHYFDKVIVSIDTLKKDTRYRRFLEDCRWDVVVVDECQNVAERGSRSQRSKLARLLARNTDGLVFTSATPHDGRPESFASLMRLLEPTAIADDSRYTAEEVSDLFIRRFQKDVRHTAIGAFHERDPRVIEPDASPAEDRALRAIDQARFRTIGRSHDTDPLFRILVLKAWLSSPSACLATLAARYRELERLEERSARSPDDLDHDREQLGFLAQQVWKVPPTAQSKLQALFGFLEELGYAPGRAGQRVVLFSERLDTLQFLSEQLAARFGLGTTERWRSDGNPWRAAPIATFTGGMPDQEQYALVQDFSNHHGAIRLLLASDAASEGLNLHHACHHLVHYDIPWSLITLEQRNGRIDRFGQESRPVLAYLLTRPGEADLRGDQRILVRLVEKETEAARNLGDVAWLMNLHDPAREERRIAKAIEEREDPDAPFVDPADDTGADWLQELLAENNTDRRPIETAEPVSLYGDDLAYAREAFTQLGLDGSAAHVEWFDDLQGFRLRAPPDLQVRYRYLPPELRRGRGGEVQLSTDRKRVMEAYDRSRDTEDGWPEWELFWELHPVAEWLNDRVLASFRRNEAPVIEVGAGLEPGEAAYLLQATLSNQRSQPVLVDWTAVRRTPLGILQVEPMLGLAQRCGLGAPLANSGRTLHADALQADLPRAVRLVRERIAAHRLTYEREAAEVLRPAVRKLRIWRSSSLDRLAQVQESQVVQRSEQTRQLERDRAEIDATYEARQRWITETIAVSPTPYVRLAAVLVRGV